MFPTCSAFSDNCMNYRNEETNSISFLEMPITSDEQLKEAEEEYIDTIMFTTASSLNYAK